MAQSPGTVPSSCSWKVLQTMPQKGRTLLETMTVDCAIYRLPLRSICKGKGNGGGKGERRKRKGEGERARRKEKGKKENKEEERERRKGKEKGKGTGEKERGKGKEKEKGKRKNRAQPTGWMLRRLGNFGLKNPCIDGGNPETHWQHILA